MSHYGSQRRSTSTAPGAKAGDSFKCYLALCVTAALFAAIVLLGELLRLLWFMPASSYTTFSEDTFDGFTVDYAKLTSVPR